MAQNASEVFRDWETDGVPSSGKHKVRKPDVRQLLGRYEQIIDAFTSNGGLVFSSKSVMDADLAYPVNRMAWVVGDPVPSSNGIYRKTGGIGSGVWTKVAELPYSFIAATDTGDGTANTIQAVSALPISSNALILITVQRANTASPVTIAFNGAPPLTIKTNSGNDVVAGGLVADMTLVGRASGSVFRLISDQASAAIIAQAEDLLLEMQTTLETAVAALIADVTTLRDEAQAAATEAAGYAEMVGAAVYDFSFDSDPDLPGYDWSE